MKRSFSRLGCTAVCIGLSLALGCGCAVLPPASNKPASSAASVPTDASGKPLYDASRLEDGRLRILYGYDNSGDSRTLLCGSKVLYVTPWKSLVARIFSLTQTRSCGSLHWFMALIMTL